MRKIKSYIIASILGLLNVIPGNINAKFVENENFPYFYDQADRVVNGIHWFRSKTNPEIVFYVLPREIDLTNEKKWKFVCKEDNKFFEKLKKYHFKLLQIDNEKIVPSDRQKGEDGFYSYLYSLYKNSETSDDNMPKNLLSDNPLDNLGWFYNGLGKGNDLLDRVRHSTRSDNTIKKLNMFAVNTGNENQTAFKVPEDFNPNVDKLHPWIQNVYKFFRENVYLQHGQKCKYKGEHPFINESIEHDESCCTPDIDSHYNLMLCGISFQDNTYETDVPLQNQKHVFFSPVIPGDERSNPLSTSDDYHMFTILQNKDFFDLPLINVSNDMCHSADKNCYIGLPKDVLKMLINDLSYNRKGTCFCNQVPTWESLIKQFTKNEVRIPVYIFADKWYQPRQYWAFPTPKAICNFMVAYEKLRTSNHLNGQTIDSSISCPQYKSSIKS